MGARASTDIGDGERARACVGDPSRLCAGLGLSSRTASSENCPLADRGEARGATAGVPGGDGCRAADSDDDKVGLWLDSDTAS